MHLFLQNNKKNVFIIFFCTGVVAFTIAASDPEGQPLTYSLNAPSDKFEVNPSTGAVTVKSTLDREVGYLTQWSLCMIKKLIF